MPPPACRILALIWYRFLPGAGEEDWEKAGEVRAAVAGARATVGAAGQAAREEVGMAVDWAACVQGQARGNETIGTVSIILAGHYPQQLADKQARE